MTPALLVITATLGLVPLLVRGSSSRLGPFEMAFDLALRVVALLLGLTLVGYVAIMELEKEPWNTAAVAATAALASWILLALGMQFLLVARHRMWLAAHGDRDPLLKPTAPQAANQIFVLTVAMAVIVAMILISVAMSAWPRDFESVAAAIVLAGIIPGAMLAAACWLIVSAVARWEGNLPASAAIARHLDSAKGGWITLRLVADATSPEMVIEVPAWQQAGRWFVTRRYARQIARFRTAAAANAVRPSRGLHAHRLTLNPTGGPKRQAMRAFGFRVWDPHPYRPLRVLHAHVSEPLDADEYGDLDPKLWDVLVPVTREKLEAAGLRVG